MTKKKYKIIAITGTPGTGKFKLAKYLAEKLKFERIDIHDLYDQISTGFDKEKDCYDIDIKAFIEAIDLIDKDIVIDSHIAHLLPCVDVCIVLKCSDLKKLEEKLISRGYNLNKVKENIECEIFDVCLIDAKEMGHKIIVVENESFEEILEKVLKIINK